MLTVCLRLEQQQKKSAKRKFNWASRSKQTEGKKLIANEKIKNWLLSQVWKTEKNATKCKNSKNKKS